MGIINTKKDQTGFHCQDCDTYWRVGEGTGEPVYHCSLCCDFFSRSDTNLGNHQCPECGKFSQKVSDEGCPECGDGYEVKVISESLSECEECSRVVLEKDLTPDRLCRDCKLENDQLVSVSEGN